MDTKQHVLVVDDEVAVRTTLCVALEQAGYAVSSAADGVEGIEKAVREHPDLLLLDIVMPKLNGMELLARLRENEWGRTAKVIFFTHLEGDDDIIRGITAYEPSMYLMKGSWEIADVIAKVNEVLGVTNPQQ
ncbi:MAG: response regulator [bacterium]|nr:response regulator [bacterium]